MMYIWYAPNGSCMQCSFYTVHVSGCSLIQEAPRSSPLGLCRVSHCSWPILRLEQLWSGCKLLHSVGGKFEGMLATSILDHTTIRALPVLTKDPFSLPFHSQSWAACVPLGSPHQVMEVGHRPVCHQHLVCQRMLPLNTEVLFIYNY